MKKVVKLSLFGVPGAGKGTQAELLTKHLTMPHISTGDMFRGMQNANSELAIRIRNILAAGELVPDGIVTEMTFERLAKDDCKNGFLLDGFPRTLAQAEALQKSEHAVDFLIEIRVERAEIIRRLAGRRVCQVCKAVYHVDSFNGGTVECRLGHGPLLQRADDMPQAVETRLDVFESNVAPVLGFYKKIGLLRSIQGEGEPEVVFGRILESIGHYC